MGNRGTTRALIYFPRYPDKFRKEESSVLCILVFCIEEPRMALKITLLPKPVVLCSLRLCSSVLCFPIGLCPAAYSRRVQSCFASVPTRPSLNTTRHPYRDSFGSLLAFCSFPLLCVVPSASGVILFFPFLRPFHHLSGTYHCF